MVPWDMVNLLVVREKHSRQESVSLADTRSKLAKMGLLFDVTTHTLPRSMKPTTVVRKTEAGVTAIKTRDKALSPRQRTVLITADGIKTVQALAQACTNLEEALQICSELDDLGFVERVPQVAPIVATRAPEVRPSAAPARPVDILPNIRRATRALENLLGPGCEPLALQLEKCKTQEELVAKVQDLRRIVASMRSEKKAEEFVAAALGN
jgi:hypothetical protein